MMYIEVNYTESWDGTKSPEITRTAKIEMNWTAGLKYTYPLQITKSGVILMSEPTVTPWNEVTSVGDGITIKQ